MRYNRKESGNVAFLKEVISIFLAIGIFYFAIKGAFILSFQCTSPAMGVSGTSMTHEGGDWKEYYIRNGMDQVSEFSFQEGLHNGDLVFVEGVDSVKELNVGDVIVWNRGDERIIHRVIKINRDEGYVRTKGDHNTVPDAPIIQSYQIVGRAVFSIPYLGYPISWRVSSR